MSLDLKNKKIIYWGSGEYSENALKKLETKFKIFGIVSQNNLYTNQEYFVIKDISELKSLKDIIVVIAECNSKQIWKISDFCRKNHIEYEHVSFIISDVIKVEFLRAMCKWTYEDYDNNVYNIDPNISNKFIIHKKRASNNIVRLGNIRVDNNVNIILIGNCNTVEIEDCTINSAEIRIMGGKKLFIGKDSMLSHDIKIRIGDAHLIFDLNTKKRINWGKDIIIGKHVWIGRGVNLLSGAYIPNNCIIGAMAVTSSHFNEKNAIIAGCPAKIIRHNIIWSHDSQENNYAYFDDCEDQSALKYL